jgi:hypothetical protein
MRRISLNSGCGRGFWECEIPSARGISVFANGLRTITIVDSNRNPTSGRGKIGELKASGF